MINFRTYLHQKAAACTSSPSASYSSCTRKRVSGNFSMHKSYQNPIWEKRSIVWPFSSGTADIDGVPQRFCTSASSGLGESGELRRQLGKKINTKKEDFPPKTFTKQELGLKTPSSYRDIPIPDYVFEAILQQREVYERNKGRRRSQFQDSGYVCCSNYGKPRSKDFHWKYYKKLLADNNLPDIKWHHLRSTFCTLLLKNNFNPKAVSKLMGHATELITLDVYGDNREIIADCVDEIQPFIDEVLPIKEVDKQLEEELLEIEVPAEDYF